MNSANATTPLSEAEVDTLLRRELTPPQPSSAWRDRVLAATLRSDTTREQARALALQELRQRSSRRIAAERQRMLQRVLVCMLIGASALALLPALLEHLPSMAGTASVLGVNVWSLCIAAAALLLGLGGRVSRPLKALAGI